VIIVNRKKRIAAAVVDTIGRILFFLFVPKRIGRELPGDVRSILAVRLAYIGDVVLTIPALKPLAQTFPEAEIVFVTSSSAREVFEENPYVDEVITYNAPWFYPSRKLSIVRQWLKIIRTLRERRFDMAIDFRGDLRNISFLVFPSGARYKVGYDITGGGYLLDRVIPCRAKKHKVEFHLDIVRELAEDKIQPDMMNLYPTDSDREKTGNMLHRVGIGAGDVVIGLHPGGRVPLKSWAPSRYATLADLLIEKYHVKIVVTGGPNEVALADRVLAGMKGDGVNMAGVLSLRQLQVLLRRVNLFVTNDTAVLHIASGVNTPTVAIFGPSEVWDTGPLSEANKVVMRPMKCRETCDTYRCNNKDYHACLRSIQPAEVMRACEALIKETRIEVEHTAECMNGDSERIPRPPGVDSRGCSTVSLANES
jgi:heptosyltransferase-2